MGGGARVEILAEAMDEARAARLWYSERDPIVGARFMAALDSAIAKLTEAPERWPQYVRGTRRCRLAKFPYSIVYRVSGDCVQVVACLHARRRPGYWIGRLR